MLPPLDDAPRVTVVLPVHNGEQYVEEAVRSAQAQTERRIEILVVDDGSTDRTRDLVRSLAGADGRVRLISKARGGSADARNVGMREARAPWIAFLDHDDVFLPDKIEAQLEFVRREPDAAIVSTYGWRMGERGKILSAFDVGPASREVFQERRTKDKVIYLLASSVMARRDVLLRLGGFRHMRAAQDVEMWTRVADDHLILTLPLRLVKYRVHGSSTSTGKLFEQLENTELLKWNTRRRRGGEPEASLQVYRAVQAGRPWPRRARRWLEWRSRYAYRRAGALLADRRPMGAAWLLGSFLLWPSVPVARIAQQMGPTLVGWRRREVERVGR